MEISINNRIKKIREHYFNDSNIEFADKLGVNPNQASNWVKEGASVGKLVITKIMDAFPEINKVWLLTGEGEMLKNTESTVTKTTNKQEEVDMENQILKDAFKAQQITIEVLKADNERLKKENEALKSKETQSWREQSAS